MPENTTPMFAHFPATKSIDSHHPVRHHIMTVFTRRVDSLGDLSKLGMMPIAHQFVAFIHVISRYPHQYIAKHGGIFYDFSFRCDFEVHAKCDARLFFL
jgi:hypothetical protein